METKIWCTKHNTMQELMKPDRDWTKQHNFALVTCVGSKCERWNNGKCGLMDKGWTG